MIYFDAAYIAKCYLNEPAADRVREWPMARMVSRPVSCPPGVCVHSQPVRERHVTRRELSAILQEFEDDEKSGVRVEVRFVKCTLDDAG